MTRPQMYNPDHIGDYRAQTEKLRTSHQSNMKTRICPGCKKSRSLTQYGEGKTYCNRCRGVK